MKDVFFKGVCTVVWALGLGVLWAKTPQRGDTQPSQLADVGWFAKGGEVRAAKSKKNGVKPSKPAAPTRVLNAPRKPAEVKAADQWVPKLPVAPRPASRNTREIRRPIKPLPSARSRERSQLVSPVLLEPLKENSVEIPPQAVSDLTGKREGAGESAVKFDDPFAGFVGMGEPLMDRVTVVPAKDGTAPPTASAEMVKPEPIPVAPPTLAAPLPVSQALARQEKVERAPQSIEAVYEAVCSCSCLAQSPTQGENIQPVFFRDDRCLYSTWDVRGLSPSGCSELSGSGYCERVFSTLGGQCRAIQEMGILSNCIYKVIPR